MAVGELRPPSTEDPLIGKVVSDRYRVIKKLGEGGMGAVYLAEHVFIEKKIALKVLSSDLARRQDLSARFLQEAKSASRIGQENVIDISDFGQSPDGLVYIAMEFLAGHDLGEMLRREGAVPWPRAKPIIMQICRALRAAHSKSIVHRDMKPENIFLITKEGRPDFVKLLDFGIAKVMGDSEEGPRLTRTGMIFGTPEYMAPEQAEGKDADHRVDIYAMGCVIYHVIAGEPPFKADSFMAMLTKHLLEEPVAPSVKQPTLTFPRELDAIILKALQKDRDKRWSDMDELMAALDAIGVPDAAPVTTSDPGSAGLPARGAATQQLGGSAPALPLVRSGRESHTEMIERDEFAAAEASARATPRRASNDRKVALIAGGVALGVIAAAGWFFLGRGAGGSKTSETAVVPAAVGIPSGPARATEPVAADRKPAVAAEPGRPTSETPPTPGIAAPQAADKHHPARAHDDDRPHYRHITAAPDDDTTPAHKGPNTPPELKPFPGQ